MKKLVKKIVTGVVGLSLVVGAFALNLNFKQAFTNFCSAAWGGGCH